MPRALDAQTFGSIVVIGAFCAAEATSAYLSAHPASELAWYLTLAVFRPFEHARAETSPLHVLFGPASLPAAAACLVATLCLRAVRSRLGIAVVANGCFAGTVALAYAWGAAHGVPRSASLMPAAALQRPDLAVVALMMASSCLACLVSHVSFVATIRSDRQAMPRLPCPDCHAPDCHAPDCPGPDAGDRPRHGAGPRPVRRARVRAVLAAALATAQPAAAASQGLGAERTPDRPYEVGRGGWSVERFGSDIAVLRTTVVSGLARTDAAGSLVLSCDAGERRMRLTLPEPLAPWPEAAATATMLLQVPQPGGPHRAGPVRIGERRILSFAEAAASNEDRVSFVVRLIRSGARRLDLMLRPHGPATAFPLTVHVLALTDARMDAVALDDFLATCRARPR